MAAGERGDVPAQGDWTTAGVELDVYELVDVAMAELFQPYCSEGWDEVFGDVVGVAGQRRGFEREGFGV
ncbi:MAG TPA: hypothetical protein VHX38_23575 [Pseudonocardiaceae bacterium]|jgi:hypothetical protein|nr:hypothetical protein [Pseudonocardiaceae bacterium]